MGQVASEVQGVLARLRLNRPDYASLLQEQELIGSVETVIAQGEFSEREAGDLTFRLVSRCFYEACLAEDETLRNLAFQWLGEHLYQWVSSKLGNNRELAEDITNTVLEKILRHIATCQGAETFIAWARQIAVNEVLQYHRRQRSQAGKAEVQDEHPGTLQKVREALESEGDVVLVADPARQPEALLLHKEMLEAIVARIEKKFNKRTKRAHLYRAILYGTYFKGESDEELGRQQNLPVKDIQKMRSYALQQLRADRDWLDSLKI